MLCLYFCKQQNRNMQYDLLGVLIYSFEHIFETTFYEKFNTIIDIDDEFGWVWAGFRKL